MSKAQEIAKVYSTSTLKELRAMFPDTSDDYFYKVAQRYNLKKTSDIIASYGRNLSQTKGAIEHRFKKGNASRNNGRKLSEYMNQAAIDKIAKTQFKKGNRPPNYKKIYSIRKNSDGYMQIKVDKTNKWKNLSTYVYESMFGTIPEGKFVRSKDGNPNNVDINNLMIVSRYENLLRNHKQHHDESDEMIECRVLMNELNKQIRYEKIRVTNR